MEKKRSFALVPWGVVAGSAVLLGGSLLSWRMAAHSEVSKAEIPVPKPETLGIVLPPESAKAVVASPPVLEDQKKPVKVRRLRSSSSEELMEQGLVPSAEEAQRMKKKGVVAY